LVFDFSVFFLRFFLGFIFEFGCGGWFLRIY